MKKRQENNEKGCKDMEKMGSMKNPASKKLKFLRSERTGLELTLPSMRKNLIPLVRKMVTSTMTVTKILLTNILPRDVRLCQSPWVRRRK